MKRFLLLNLIVQLTVFVLYSQTSTPTNRPGQSSNFQGMAGNAFTATIDPAAPVTYHNPVITGFWSDPGDSRVGKSLYSKCRSENAQGPVCFF